MYTPRVFVTTPDPALFQGMFPPSSEPRFLPPPAPGSIPSAPPFAIPNSVYHAALDAKVPITVAALYTITAKLLNAYNISNAKKPWAISQTRLFHTLVVAHNVFLAAYSAWTFCGMTGVMRRSVVNPWGPGRLNGFVDSLTSLHGPGGLGNAVYYDQQHGRWQAHSNSVLLAGDGTPSPTDTGRIWNEGLALYGWLFYLSKFYEVLDTCIILAKGKLSSTLQTYHHAGAMMCMWAGMRYMSPPIWMFVLVNSGIHAIMYTYYALSVFSIRVPLLVKRTLTSLQITQFLVGASYAMMHSFVSFTVPAAITVGGGSSQEPTPALPAHNVFNPAFLDNLKRLVLGNAFKTIQTGAVTVPVSAPEVDAGSAPISNREIIYTDKVVPCISTTGQTFAIWLNVLYLAPLTYLFVKFFITSYLRRSSAGFARVKGKGHPESQAAVAEKAGWDAAQGIQQEVYGTSGTANGHNDASHEDAKEIDGVCSGRSQQTKDNLRMPGGIRQADHHG